MTTLLRSADTAFTFTLTVEDEAQNLVTPTVTPTVSMFTDPARSLGEVVLTVTPTAQPQVFTVTGPATAQGPRYLKQLITTALGVRIDADDDLLFLAVSGNIAAEIVTAAELRAQCNIPPTDTSSDAALLSYASSHLPIIEEMIGGPVLPRQVVEVHHRTGATIILRLRRPLSVASVTASGVALTAYTDEAGYGWELDGELLRLGGGGHSRVSVAYTAGYSIVPDNVKQALLLLVQEKFSKQRQGYMPGYGEPNDEKSVSAGPSIADVRLLLGPELRGSRIV